MVATDCDNERLEPRKNKVLQHHFFRSHLSLSLSLSLSLPFLYFSLWTKRSTSKGNFYKEYTSSGKTPHLLTHNKANKSHGRESQPIRRHLPGSRARVGPSSSGPVRSRLEGSSR